MTYEECEFLVSRITAGYSKFKHIKLYAQKYDYELDLIYNRAYNSAIKRGCLSTEEVDLLLYDLGIWTEVEEEQERKIVQELDSLKVSLYQEFLTVRVITIKQAITKVYEKLAELTLKKSIYNDFSAKGCADYIKTCYYIKRYSEPSVFNRRLLSYYHRNGLSDSVLRSAARTEPWASTYTTKKLNGQIFDKDLTFDQIRLLRWSLMYERIAEHPEAPPDRVLNDDDALDGWLIIQQRERDKKQKKSVQLNDNQKDAQEIYIPANSLEEVQEINSMNEGMAKAIRQSRTKAIREKGEVAEQNLPDVRKSLKMELARLRAANNG
jgi:hypothetical protein